MNQIIYKSIFQTVKVEDKVSTIDTNHIDEFTVGKNFVYKVKNQVFLSLQKHISNLLSNKIELNNASIAFRKNLSYLHLFEPHRKNYHFLRLDIRSFFHSIEVDDIRDIFKSYIPDDEYIDKGKKQSLLEAFINVITYTVPNNSKNEKFRGKQILPMGFSTSPIISNIIFRKLDIQIQKLCAERGIEYTRYADDMLFSSAKKSTYVHSDNFIREIQIIIFQMKFKLNEHKTIKAKHTLSLNGYTIQYDYIFKDKELDDIQKLLKSLTKNSLRKKIHELRLSNKKTNIIKKIIHMINKEKKSSDIILKKLFQYQIKWSFVPDKETSEKYNREQLLHKILGYRSYLLSIVRFNKKYHCTLDETIDKYINIINDLEKISNDYQKKIDKLEKIIEKNKLLNRMSKILIEKLLLTDWQKEVLSKNEFKTLKDLDEITEVKLMRIKGIGQVKVKKMMEVIMEAKLKV